MKYFRLFRFGDQYPIIGSAIAGGIFVNVIDSWILVWAITSALLSASGFALNEIVDSQDVDKESWNPIHVANREKFNTTLLWVIIASVIIIGLFLSYVLQVLWWGVFIVLLWTVYSVPPFRFKGAPIVDLLCQILGTWVPFFAVVQHYQLNLDNRLLFTVIPLSCILGVGYLQYQLGDYELDKKYGLKSTHVVLGMKKSINLAIYLTILSFILFYMLKTWKLSPWAWVFIPFSVYNLIHLQKVRVLGNLARQMKSFQIYVMQVKPISWLVVPFLFCWWILML